MRKIGEVIKLLSFFVILTQALSAEPVHLVMVGPPGAGKGTQAEQLAEHYKAPHISTGAMLRDNISRQTELGISAKRYVDSGELVPNEIIVAMLKERLASEKNGFILDGFPRSVDQAEILDQIMAELSLKLDGVVNIQVPDSVVIERLVKRGRKDDTPEVIQRRLEVYAEETAPVVDYYDRTGRIFRIDGSGAIEEVHARIRSSIESTITSKR